MAPGSGLPVGPGGGPQAGAGSGPLVAVVVLNFNNAADTVGCLDSLRALRGPGVAVPVVVDNASTDDSWPVLQAWAAAAGLRVPGPGDRPEAAGDGLLLRAPRNAGYAAGNNLGLRAAEGWADFLWVLNNDTVVDPGALAALLAAPGAGDSLVGATVVDFGGTRVQCAGGGWYSLWTTRTRAALEGVSLAEARSGRARLPRPLGFVSGCSVFLSRRVWRRVGPLDERFFLYFEETDLAFRAARLGVPSVWAPGAVVFHKGGASTGARSAANRRKSGFAEYHSTLSALRFSAKHLGAWAVVPAALRLALKVVFLAARGEWGLFRPLLAAYLAFARGGPA